MSGQGVDARAIVDSAAAATSGVAHADTLVRFAEALVADDDTALAAVRQELRDQLGDAELVDAAAVASNFERMVRIADSTGIPLDTPLEVVSQSLRSELGLEKYGSSANTPQGGAVRRTLGAVAGAVLPGALRAVGALRRRRSSKPD